MAGRRSVAARGSIVDTRPIAGPRSTLAPPRLTAGPKFAAMRHSMAAAPMAAVWRQAAHIAVADRVAEATRGVVHMAVARLISRWGLRTMAEAARMVEAAPMLAAARTAVVARMAAGEAASAAEQLSRPKRGQPDHSV